MRISSSWLTLGASLSLLIPAWTANAQEFTLPLKPYTDFVLEPDATIKITSFIPTSVNTPKKSEILKPKAELVSNHQPILQDIQVMIAALPKADLSDTSKLAASESTITQDSQRSQPEKVSSSTEPARVLPSAAASNSGQLDPAQTLVVPTTPSQVRLDITKPVTLSEILDLIEKTNSDAIRARIAIDRARAVLQEAEAARAPTLDGSLQYSYNGSVRLNNNQPSTNPLSASLEANYNIYDSGLKEASIRVAENNLRIAEADMSRIRQNIRLGIVTAYYKLQSADENVRIQRKAVENAERSLKDTKARERAGVGTKFDVLQSDVQLANSKQDLLNAEAAQLVARRELSRQLNYPATVEITAADKIEPVPEWKLPIEETILLALRNRADLDIRKLEREVARDRASTSLARVGPRVNLFVNLNPSNEFISGSNFGVGYQVGARLDWNLYDGGRANAQVDQSKADQAIAETRFEQDARQARFDVEDSYINQRSRLQQIDTATKAVQQAAEALRLARLRLDAGVGTQLEVITAESDLTRADVNRVQAIIGYNQSRANLERAVSGL
ncbi:MAG: TolC family protein [Pseudanabaena sp.]|nr:MAG: TolC family protein [Pseudanabaena sp.]